MKYKLLALMVSLAAGTALEGAPSRYHQHLEEPGYTPCADHGDGVFCSHLPLVFIETGGQEIPGVPIPDGDGDRQDDRFTTAPDGSATILADMKVVDAEGENHHLYDTPSAETKTSIRVRGNSSRYFDKKSYLIRPLKEDGVSEKDLSLLGMDAFDEWALYGPYLDKSLIRNYMWYNIAGEIMDYTPNVRFCEVFLNGAYQGLYVLTETISSGENARLKLSQPVDGSARVPYVLRLDRGSDNALKNIDTFTQYALRNLQDVDIVYPGAKQLTPERIDYIRQDFSAFEKALYSYDYDTGRYAWWKQMDMDSMVDYFVLNEFTCNYDAGWLSTYIYKDVGLYKLCNHLFHAVSLPKQKRPGCRA